MPSVMRIADQVFSACACCFASLRRSSSGSFSCPGTFGACSVVTYAPTPFDSACANTFTAGTTTNSTRNATAISVSATRRSRVPCTAH